MSDLVNITPVTTKTQGYQLQNQQDMFTALDYVSAFPGGKYTGMVQVQNNAGTLTWALLLNNAVNNASAFAEIGDIIVIENDSVVSVCKQAEFGNRYTVGG